MVLVEGAALLDDEFLRDQAAQLFARYSRHLSHDMDEGGMGGFALLAAEIAALERIQLPAGLRSRLQQHIARPLPSKVANAARLGIAAYGRQINGAGHALSTADQLNQLMSWLPGTSGDERLDLMAWYFPTLALREARDRRWAAWNGALEGTLLAKLEFDASGTAKLPGHHMRYGDQFGHAADLTATAFAMMALQAPYRYLPVGF